MTYKQRYEDINVQKVVIRGYSAEYYGEKLDGSPVWIQMYFNPNTEWIIKEEEDERTRTTE